MDLAGLSWVFDGRAQTIAAVDSGIEWKTAVKKNPPVSLGRGKAER